ncbi:MAG: hypothetical protein WBR29_07565 [Gammaproteobacteria bacterium]
MPKMVITYGVADVETWLSFKQERAESIAAVGGRNPVDLPAQDGSHTVAVMADTDDPAAVMAVFASPPAELVAMMQRHGVLLPRTVYVEK